jgi:plasmid replication initiation protein
METDIGQLELFVADIFDVAVKGDIESMESPMFALSTKPDTAKWIYQNGDTRLEVSPSTHGRPTIFDKDLLMYCISQVVEGGNRGKQISRRVQFTAHQFLKATGRGTAGKDYTAMFEAMKRLRGVTLSFEGHQGKARRAEVKGLIDSAEVVESTTTRMASVEITLSEWVYEAIESKHVLTYHPDYYKLRKPNERRLYEICRKFCGSQPIWEIGAEKLHSRFGTRSSFNEWMRAMKKLVPLQTIPEYIIEIDDERSMFIVEYVPKVKPPLAAPEAG